jgi:AraC-like DNA-binding protein
LQLGGIFLDFSDINFPQQRQALFKDISPSVHWAKHHTTRTGYEYAERRIYDFELLYVHEGSILAYLDHHCYSLSDGQILFISAGIPHYIKVVSDSEVTFLGIHFDFFDELEIIIDQEILVDIDNVHSENFCYEPIIEGFEALSVNPIIIPSPQTINEMKEIIEEFNEHKPGFETVCKGLLQQVIVQLFRAQYRNSLGFSTPYGERILELTNWIETHYSDTCSNSSLAAMVNLNEDYLAKQFKAVTGLSPNKYVQKIRHRESKRLLRETDLTVESIGHTVGYEDLHYFSRIFHKWEGISPRQYRKLSLIY